MEMLSLFIDISIDI